MALEFTGSFRQFVFLMVILLVLGAQETMDSTSGRFSMTASEQRIEILTTVLYFAFLITLLFILMHIYYHRFSEQDDD
ncbi:MAG: hypothetical protein ACFFDT_08025 [Candidatus Hodarchaeota archaeon]